MASSDYTFLAGIFTSVDTAVNTYIGGALGGVLGAVMPVALQCFTLYVILWGFAMYRGMIQEPILDMGFRMMRMGIILSLATNLSYYGDFVRDTLLELPDYLIDLMGGGTTTGGAKVALDEILSDSLDVMSAFWEKGSLLSDPGPLFAAIIVLVGSLVSIGYAAFLIILSKVALGVLVAMGPIFICCLIFEGTKKFFEAWLGQAINFVLISGLTVAVVRLLFGTYQSAANGALGAAASDDFGMMSIISMLLLSVICFLVLMQVMSIASALGGGVAISTLGAVRALGRAAGSAGRVTNKLRPSNIKRGVDGVKADIAASKAAYGWARRKFTGADRNSLSKAA